MCVYIHARSHFGSTRSTKAFVRTIMRAAQQSNAHVGGTTPSARQSHRHDAVPHSGVEPPAGPESWAVIAIGINTHAWGIISDEFPDILSCCIDVRDVLGRESDESTRGTGFDNHTRVRMKAKELWAIVWEVASIILREFGLLVFLCNCDRHRSLSLAIELALHFGCKMISNMMLSSNPVHRPNNRSTKAIMHDVRYPLHQHRIRFRDHPNPIISIHSCIQGFDGVSWAIWEDESYRLPVCRTSSLCPVVVHASHPPSPLSDASSNGVEPLAAGLSAPPNIALDETLVSLVSGGPAASILHRTKTETAYIATTCVTG